MVIGYVLDDTLDVADGVQQAMISIAESMRKKGHDVHYIVPNTKRRDLDNIHSVGNFLSLKFNGNSVRTPLPVKHSKIKKVFNDIQFDVLHVQTPYSPVFAAKVIKQAPAQTKIFATFHILPYNIVSRIGTKLLGLILKKSNKRIDKAYAVSQPACEFMEEYFGLGGSVLPNPVDYEFFHDAIPTKFKKLSIVYVGRFEERKGVKKLVEAYALLDEIIKDKIHLTMCGKGPLFDSVSQSVRVQKLDISLPGFVTEEQKASLLAGSDIAIFPSISGESFGIVLTEAMAAGANVTIGGNNPGYASVLQKWPEVLFNAKDSAEIANTLTKFIENDSLRYKLGLEQHEYVKHFDIHRVVDQLESDYSTT